jgi:DNA polymerase IV
MTERVGRRILLVDCDAYFVQVARLEDPEGVGREPLLLIGGSASGRGVVTSASYEVRKYGVRSGMPTAQALRLCPKAVVAPVPREACSRRHREIRAVLDRWSPVVAAASIDEFYLDLSGTESLYRDESLERLAWRIREAVLAATHVSVSIGGGTSRLVAKIAVSRGKPAGVHVVPPGGEAEFLRSFPLRAIPGIGPKADERLARLGLRTVADAVDLGQEPLRALVGRGFGEWLWRRAHGIDSTVVRTSREAKSISRDETFSRDIDDDAALDRELLRLVTLAASDIRAEGLSARTVTVRIRDADFRTRAASRTLAQPIATDRPIRSVARVLLRKLRHARRIPARLLSVALTNFDGDAGGAQLGMFDALAGASEADALENERDRTLSRVLDTLRAKHGRDAIVPGDLVRRPRGQDPGEGR